MPDLKKLKNLKKNCTQLLIEFRLHNSYFWFDSDSDFELFNHPYDNQPLEKI